MHRFQPFWTLLAGLLVGASILPAQAENSESGTISPPRLDPRSDQRVDLVFAEPTSVLDIYRSLGEAWGVNLVFDPKLRDREIAIELKGVAPRQGFESVLRATGQFYTVVDPHTLLIADDTPQNRRTYEHQVIQAFYLENARVKDMMTAVRSLIGAKHVAAMERSNRIVLRDTADKVRVAEQILRRNDRPRAEVVVDVDLLSVDRRAMARLGLKAAADSVAAAGVPSRLGAGEIDRLRQLGSTRALARPRLDVVADSTAELRLTDRLPIPGHLAPDGAAPARSGQAPPAVVYREVGLEVKVRPWVHTERDVTLSVEIVADTVTDWSAGADGEQRPTFGGVALTSRVRLRDGETYLMTGLMIVPERAGAKPDALPLGRFLHQAGSGGELVLALTPHVVRGPGLGAADLEPLWVGTEVNVTLEGGPRAAGPSHGPFDREPGAKQ